MILKIPIFVVVKENPKGHSFRIIFKVIALSVYSTIMYVSSTTTNCSEKEYMKEGFLETHKIQYLNFQQKSVVTN